MFGPPQTSADYLYYAAKERRHDLEKTLGDMRKQLEKAGSRVVIVLNGGCEVGGVALPEDRSVDRDMITLVDLKDGDVEIHRIHLNDFVSIRLVTHREDSPYVVPGDEIRVAREEMAFAAIPVFGEHPLLTGLDVRADEVKDLEGARRAQAVDTILDRVTLHFQDDFALTHVVAGLPEALGDAIPHLVEKAKDDHRTGVYSRVSELENHDQAVLVEAMVIGTIVDRMPRFAPRSQYADLARKEVEYLSKPPKPVEPKFEAIVSEG